MAQGRYLIGTCDGGGIRSLITTLLLQDLTQPTLDQGRPRLRAAPA